jgi:isopenicillin-N N-acyltransferase-like protein
VSADDPFERGFQLGRASAEYVRESLAVYEETFAYYTGLGWEAIRERAAAFLAPIERYDELIAREIKGLAAGASVALEDVLAINARTEIMFGLSVLPPAECTSFFVGPSASSDGHALIGQNWDWRTRTARTTLLVEVEQQPRPSFLMLAEAGLVGKLGFNAAGLGVAANTLVSDLDRGIAGVPFHVVLRGILNSRSLSEAVDAVTRADRAASANYLIGTTAGSAVNIETAPGGADTAFRVDAANGLIAHANNFDAAVPFTDASLGRWVDSPVRKRVLGRMLESHRGTLNRRSIPRLLKDHTCLPNAICRHPDTAQHEVERSSTVASWVIDLTDQIASVCAGPPCQGSYIDVSPSFQTAAVEDRTGEGRGPGR